MTSEAPRATLNELAQTLHTKSLAELFALLNERSWSIRREAIARLAAIGEPALAELWRSLEHERDSETRIAATVDTLVASAGDVESVLISAPRSAPALAADVAQVLGRRRNPRSVPTLIALLDHEDDNVAVAAIEALGRVGGRTAVDALVDTVERDHFFRTYPSIDVLGRSGDPRAVAPLAKLLRKSQYMLEAARALGRTADKSAVAPLCELLSSATDSHVRVATLALAELYESHLELYGESTQVLELIRRSATDAAVRRISQTLAGADSTERIASCFMLGALQNETAAPALVRMLDGVPGVASAAAAALKQLGRATDDHESLRRALVEGDSARRLVLLPLMPQSDGSAEVLACLGDPDAKVRAMACDALARMGDRATVPRLFELLQETNPRVVQAAMAAIQSLGTAGNEALAIEAARSASPGARRAALRILSYFGSGAAIDVFSDAMHDSDARVQDVAITGVALLEHPRARALLLTAAKDPSTQVRTAAMRGLGQSAADADVRAALRVGLADPEAWVRYYACQSLGKLRVQDAAPAIAELLSDSAGQVRVAAVEALSHLKGESSLVALSQAAKSPDPDVMRAALIGLSMKQDAESLELLIAACASADAATRLVALSAVCAFKTSEALAVVARAMNDDDEGVRVSAIGFLGSWPEREATRLLIVGLRVDALRPHVTRALSTPVHGRVEGLLAALETAGDELAPTLTSLLRRVDPADETGALLEALRMPNAAARKAAAAMLAAKGGRAALDAIAHQAAEDVSDEVRRVCALLLTQ